MRRHRPKARETAPRVLDVHRRALATPMAVGEARMSNGSAMEPASCPPAVAFLRRRVLRLGPA